jgi:hypothetical protein
VKKSHASLSRAQARRLAEATKHEPAPTHTEEKPKDNSTPHGISAPEKRTVLGLAWKGWQVSWALLGPIFGYLNFAPAISITPGPNLDKTQTYSTQIFITNTGKVPVYDLSFSCVFGGATGRMDVRNLADDSQPDDLAPVQRLAAGQPITKACATTSDVGGNNRLTFVVNFKWPLIGYRDSRAAVFDVKEGPEGHFLLPSGSP